MGNNRSASFDTGSNNYSQNSNLQQPFGISPGTTPTAKRRRGYSIDSGADREDYGWFEDFESPYVQRMLTPDYSGQPLQPLQRALTLPPSAAEPPLYILESSLETQHLWYATAGRRPKQPTQEREYFEKLWQGNFEQSSVKYHPNDLSSKKTTKVDIVPKQEINGEVLYRGKSPFSNSVSKSFFEGISMAMTLQMPFYRIFRSIDGNIHAEYLIKVTIGGNSPVTFGIWKRHSHFCELAKSVMSLDLKSGSRNIYKNAILSWQCVLQRKRWYRSLDKDYLALKCFLLERFLHDVLFESAMPGIINKFLGLEL